MKVALYLDNMTEIQNGAPELWSVVTKLLVDNGHEVHVVTDEESEPEENVTEEDLKNLNIAHTKLAIVPDQRKVDYCYENGIEFAVGDYTYDCRRED